MPFAESFRTSDHDLPVTQCVITAFPKKCQKLQLFKKNAADNTSRGKHVGKDRHIENSKRVTSNFAQR